MRLSTKSRFAVTAMIDMGLRQHLGPVPLAAISQRQNISVSYLEQIFSKMRQHGLVDSTRGPGGGYTLNRDPHKISVADIINAANSHEDAEQDESRKQLGYVATDELWDTLNQKIEAHMSSISLQSLIAEQKAKDINVPDYTPPHRGVFAKKQEVRKINAPNSVFALGAKLASSQ